MRAKFGRLLGVAALLAGLHWSTGCSSSQQQAQEDAVVEQGEYEEQGQQGQEGENYAEEGYENSAEGGEEGGGENYAEEGAYNNAEEGYNGASEEGYNTASEEGYNAEGSDTAAGGDQASDNTMLAGGEGQGDLQEIINEMNAPVDANAGAAPAGDSEVAAADGTDMAGGDMAAGGNMAAPTNAAPVGDSAMATDAGGAAPAAAPTGGLPEMGSKMSYVVQKGDTLAKIATRIYGDMGKWREIADFTGLANPSWIYPGDVIYYQLTEQTMAFAQAYENVQRAEVEVMQGDTLSTIAGRVLGDSSNWKAIWRQNDNIDNPDRLTAGTRLFYIEQGALTAAVEQIKVQIAEASKKVETIKDNVVKAFADNQPVKTKAEVIKVKVKPVKVNKTLDHANSIDNEIEADFLSAEVAAVNATRII